MAEEDLIEASIEIGPGDIEACAAVANQIEAWLAPADRTAIFDLLVQMSEMQVPRDRDAMIDAAVYTAMVNELQDLPLHAIQHACQDHRRKSAFFPTVADLRRLAFERTEAKRLELFRARRVMERGKVRQAVPPKEPIKRETLALLRAMRAAMGEGSTVDMIYERAHQLLDDPEFEPASPSDPHLMVRPVKG